MKKKSEGKLIFIFLVSIVLLAVLVSASIFDWLKNPRITGKATDQPTNVSVAITGLNPVIIYVWNNTLTGATVTPNENATKTIMFNVTISDIDGVNDINASSVTATFNRTSEPNRTTATACAAAGTPNTTSQNYTCSIDMWYFDQNGTWTINVTANDLGNKTYYNDTTKGFRYGDLISVVISPTLVTWPALSGGDKNKTSIQNTTVNNTGNILILEGNVKVNGVDLQGQTTTTTFFSVTNFTASWNETGPEGSCNNASGGSGVRLLNATDRVITGVNLTRGNNTFLNGTGQEIIYYCIPLVPQLSSQTYATNSSGAWTVKVVG